MDYYFGLDIEVPLAGDEHYSEQLIRMDVMNSAPIRKVSGPVATRGIVQVGGIEIVQMRGQ